MNHDEQFFKRMVSGYFLSMIPMLTARNSLYVKLGRTEEARQIIVELFRKTSVTMLVCYLGFLLFGASMFFAVVSGWTPFPPWACVFNVLPLMLLLFLTRVGGSGNWAGAIMFISLLFLI